MADLSESSWPGERIPSRYDVASANEIPDTEFVSAFKNALFSSSDAAGCQNLMHMDLRSHQPTQAYTYPMAVLSEFPTTPSNEELMEMWAAFSLRSSKDPIYRALLLPQPPNQPRPPHLRFAVACLACVMRSDAHDSDEIAKILFDAGMRLWIVMSEVDNREARTLDTISAAILLCNYGFLTSDFAIWRRSELLLCCSATMARRMRLLDRTIFEHMSNVQKSAKSNSHSGIASCMFIVDVIGSLHTGHHLNLSSRELTIHMSGSNHQFQDVFKAILQPGNDVSANISPDDAILLLFALISESICLRRSLAVFLPSETLQVSSGAEEMLRNPHIPFAVNTEFTRMDSRIALGLTRWAARFTTSVSSDVLAFFHFCQLYRSCPDISRLPRLAGYKPFATTEAAAPCLDDQIGEIDISENTVGHAWLVLDHAATKTLSAGDISPMWLPIVLFYAGLVIWARARLGELKKEKYGSLKLLLVFKLELEKLPWPCCAEMAATLDRLMSKT